MSLERQLADYGQHLRQAIADLKVPVEPAVRPSLGQVPAHRRRRLIAAAAGAAAVAAIVLAVLFWPRNGDPAPFIEEGSTIPQPTTTVPVIPVLMVDDAQATTASVTSPDDPGFNPPEYLPGLGGPVLAVSAEEVWTASGWIDSDELQFKGSVVWRRQGGVNGAWEWHTLPGAEVLQLAMTPDGTVWAATWLAAFSLDSDGWTRRFDGPVGAIAVDTSGTVWIGGRARYQTEWGLWLARWEGESFLRVDLAPQAPPEEVPRFGGRVIVSPGPDGDVWIYGPGVGLMRFDGETMEAVQVGDYRGTSTYNLEMLAVEVAPNGDLWVAGHEDSPYPFIARFDGEVWTVWDWPFGDFPGFGGYFPLFCDMAIGPDGVVWFSWGGGLAGGPSKEGGLGSFDGQEWVIRITGAAGWVQDGVDVAPDGTVWYLLGDGLHRLDG